MANRTISEMKAHLVAKADASEDFRTRLVADPKPVISAELGVSIPERFTIQVHEDDVASAHVVLPLSDQLTDEELAEIAAGVDVNWDTVNIS